MEITLKKVRKILSRKLLKLMLLKTDNNFHVHSFIVSILVQIMIQTIHCVIFKGKLTVLTAVDLFTKFNTFVRRVLLVHWTGFKEFTLNTSIGSQYNMAATISFL